jgi:fatty-acyl-CoA synthase
MTDHRASVLVVVPVLLQRILALGPDALVGADLSALRIIASSGSALGPALATAVRGRFGSVMYNLYGSTEVAVATIADPHDLEREPGTAGRPALGVKVQILDTEGRRVPRGQTGRVFVGGAMRFEGYTGGGDKEHQRGLLATGDLGHFNSRGLLMIDGREDDMVISGGENVFPGEIEELLAGHPFIEEVAVIGMADEQFGQALAAFAVIRPGVVLTEEDVQEYVRDRLARFKVPRRVEFLERLPRTSTGKVLKRQLVDA